MIAVVLLDDDACATAGATAGKAINCLAPRARTTLNLRDAFFKLVKTLRQFLFIIYYTNKIIIL